MSDRNVLDLALEDQQQARDRIEELRQQIAEEESRIEAIDGFVATYRQYEERLGGKASEETTPGDETDQQESHDGESNGAAYAGTYSSYRPYSS